jgi:hypothetical protein
MVMCSSTSQLSSSSSVNDIARLSCRLSSIINDDCIAVSTMNYDTVPTVNDLIRIMD